MMPSNICNRAVSTTVYKGVNMVCYRWTIGKPKEERELDESREFINMYIYPSIAQGSLEIQRILIPASLGITRRCH